MKKTKTSPDNILRLKYRLEPKENDMVEFQILEQHESLRKKGIGSNEKFHGTHRGWNVFSGTYPAVYECIHDIYLRGQDKQRDNKVYGFVGHDLIPSIHKALEEMVKKVYGNCRVIKS